MSPLFPYALPLLLAALTSTGLAAYAFRNRRAAPGATAFALTMTAVAVWALGNALQLGAEDLMGKLRWAKLQHVGVVSVPVGWLGFALLYTGRERWITRRSVALAAVIPALTLALVSTTESHGLFWHGLRVVRDGPLVLLRVEHGPWFWVHLGYSYLGLLLGTLALLPRLLAASGVYRWQAGSLLVGVAVPWASNAFYVLGRHSLRLDPTPFAMTVSGLIFAWGLFRYRLFILVPVAREAVIEEMADGMLVLDTEGRIVDLNPAARQVLGLPAAGALGLSVRRLPKLQALVERPHDASEQQAEITLGEGERLRQFDLRISPLVDGRGHARGRLVVFRDVSDRRRAEAELVAQKQLFENLLAVARATTERPTLGATLQNTLEVASALTGAEGASLLLLDEKGTVTRSLMAHGHVPLMGEHEAARSVLDKGLAGWVAQKRQVAVVRDTREDERWLPMPTQDSEIRSALGTPIASGRTLVGILTLVHSEPGFFEPAHVQLVRGAAGQIALALRNAQIFDACSRMADRQTLLYEVLRAVGEELDPDAVAHRAVSAIAQRTDWPHVAVALPSDDGKTWRLRTAARSALLLEEQPLGAGVIGRAHKSGSTQLVPDVTQDPDYLAVLPAVCSELAVPILQAGRALGVLNLESDQPAAFGPDDALLAESLADAVALALDKARLYRTLASEHQRLVELEKMRDELTSTLVHDLRNPLTSVRGVMEALELTPAGALTPGQREMLKVARHSAQRMADLIDAILDVSRLENGSMPVARERVAIEPLVRETLDLQAPVAEDKRLRLECEVAERSAVCADPGLLGRVLQNLIGNAVKFTPAGGCIRVSAALEPSDARMLRIAVSDTGPGISDEVRDRLFQKFASAGPGRGTGLGLAFCRLAIEAQGGRIWEDSAACGATFCFTLPAA